MQFAPSSALVILVAILLALWPVAFLLAVIHHSFTRQWRRVGKIALLLPLWTIAASVGLMQLASFSAAADAPLQSPNSFVAAAGIGFAVCCAAVAWWLLVRSFGGRTSSP